MVFSSKNNQLCFHFDCYTLDNSRMVIFSVSLLYIDIIFSSLLYLSVCLVMLCSAMLLSLSLNLSLSLLDNSCCPIFQQGRWIVRTEH